MGLVFDTFGRKIPIVFGLILTAMIVATIPFSGPSLYPWYAIGQCIFVFGDQFGFIAPLNADYVDRESLGLAICI